MDKYNEGRKVGCCPNPDHNDSTPSCSYNPKTYSFHCFGCGLTVDLIGAYMLKYGDTFSQACERLFQEAGIDYDFTERGVKSNHYYYPKPMYADDKSRVYEYWASREISPQTIDYLGIQEDKQGNTLFQYWDLNDVLVTCKVRVSGAVPKGKTKAWCLKDNDGKAFDVTNILYNINKINTSQPLIITSGEGDCASAIECGFYNTTSICLGDQNTQWITNCWEFLNQFNEIILIHDNDDSGRKFAKDVSTRLGEYRVKIANIPLYYENNTGEKIAIKDLNDLLCKCGREVVKEVINNAQETEISAVVDYSDVQKFDMSDVPGFVTGFKELDSAIDKFYMGTTTVLTGISGSGKSSFLSTLICQSVEQGFPCFVYSGELSNPSLKNWVDCVHAGQRGMNQYQSGSSAYYKVSTYAYQKINEYYHGQCFFYKDGFGNQASTILKTMESVVRRYGVKTLVIDNMTSVDLENDDNNKYMKQDEFIRNVIEFSKKWQVACIVVLHPRKMEAVRRMSVFDLQGVVSAVNLAHRVISLYRVPPKEKQGIMGRNGKWFVEPCKYDVELDILKDRFGSGTNKTIGLYYDIPSRRFFDTRETLDYQYSWDTSNYGTTPLPYGCPQLEADEEVFG